MYFSRKALGDMSYERQVERCCRMDSIVWRGCCRVTRRYFCRDLLRLGNTAWAASYGLSGCFRPPEQNIEILKKYFNILKKYPRYIKEMLKVYKLM